MPDGPLSGINVLDLTWVVAGPTVGRVFADYGATVIHAETSHRVETARAVGPNHGGVSGPEQSALYGNMQAGKLGIALDLSFEDARGVVRDLVRWADVVMESFTPGVMKGWGLDYEALQRLKPDLVMLSTCLLGQTGPRATVSGFGQQGAAMAGFQHLAGWPDRTPAGSFGPYTDYVAPRFAIAALLAALDHRLRTGEGTYIDQAQAESALHFLAPVLVDYSANGHETERAGNDDLQFAPHGLYPCLPEEGATEGWVAVAVRHDADWAALAGLLGRSELVDDRRFANAEARLAHRRELDELVAAWTALRTANEAELALQGAAIPAHKAANSRDAANDPQLQQRGHFIELDHPIHGKTVVEGSRYKLSRTPAIIEQAAPTYGRDSERILRDILEYDEERIANLAAAGALE